MNSRFSSLLKKSKSWFLELELELEDFWFAPVTVAPLALMRIGLGLTMFAAYLLYASQLEQLFGVDGLSSYVFPGEHFSRNHLWIVWWTLVISSLTFSLGFLTKFSGILLIAGHLLIVEQTRLFSWGWVPTVPAFLAYLSLGPSHRGYSIDAYLFGPVGSNGKEVLVPAWALRLIQVHIIAIYLGAGWHRIDDIAWWRGEMVYDALSYAFFSRFPTVDWDAYKPILALANWGAWALELFAPLGLMWNKTRLWFALGLATMHFGLELTSTIGWWQFMMLILLFAYYPEKWSSQVVAVVWKPMGKFLQLIPLRK